MRGRHWIEWVAYALVTALTDVWVEEVFQVVRQGVQLA
jgi:hypothetical protein